jgi:hypothetical protein
MNEVIERQNDEFIDVMEALMLEANNPIECPLTHRFTKGLYTREIFMPKGTLLTSKIHNTEHQFIVSQGIVEVSIDGGKSELIVAPFHGITKKGTRRMLFIHEDCIWTTIHAINIHPKDESEEAIKEAVQKIEDTILVKHENKFIENKKILQ